MRSDNLEFTAKKTQHSQSPIFVIEISFNLSNTDQYYLTTHDVAELTGQVSQRSLKIISGTSQKLNPSKANSTIGGLKFDFLDFGSTELFRTKLSENKGLRGKRVRLYKGFDGLLWSQFSLINTFIISNEVSFKSGVYSFNCSDIQRSMKQKIFIDTSTAIMAPLSAEADEIEILETSKFNLVYQVESDQGKTLLRGLQQRVHPSGHAQAGQKIYPQLDGVDKIGLIRIPGSEEDEIAIWTGKETGKLTGLIRGVLGTTPVEVEVESGINVNDAPKITEYVYVDMPAVKAAYALLTGSIYGAPGEFLPDHWHLGISTDYIQTSSFINIGSDIWDLSDDDKGFPVVIKGVQDVDAKKFIEEKIFYMIGVYPPINSEGELTLKRAQYIGPNGSFHRLLDEKNIVSHSNIKYGLSDIENAFLIKWNWNESQEKFTRTSAMYDPVSIERYGASDVKIVELETLHGSRHSDKLIRSHFDSLRDRYASPPITLTVTLTPDEEGIEVGDIVRASLVAQEDFTNESGHSKRNYEVQQVSTDHKTGRVTLSLFGSSQRASDISGGSTSTISDLFLESEGTEINATNFPDDFAAGRIISADGITTISGSITLTGHDNIKNAAAIYYCKEDLTNAASGVINITKNVQIRVKGFFQQNGLIDGKGAGLPGGISDNIYDHVENPINDNLGVAGVGTTQAGGGWKIKFTPEGIILSGSRETDQSYEYKYAEGSLEPRAIEGRETVRPLLALDDSGDLVGLPDSLMGTSGSSGSANIRYDRVSTTNYTPKFIQANGGNGGNGGAGLAILSKGMAVGVSSVIDLSGDDGEEGGSDEIYFNNYDYDPVRDVVKAGAGAGGCPGELLIVTLDSSQTFPDVTDDNFRLENGVSPNSSLRFDRLRTKVIGHQTRLYRYPGSASRDPSSPKWGLPASNPYRGGGLFHEATNWYDSNVNISFLDISSTPVEDLPPFVEAKPTFTLTEKKNTPVTPKGDISSIEVSVTRPVFGAGEVDNYSYSMVDYRIQGESLWLSADPASHESVIQVPSDGSTYEVRIRSVSKSKNINDTGEIKLITVTDINGRNDAALSLIYPFDAITNLTLQGESDNTFAGRDISIEWDNSNSEYTYFNYYQVDIYSGAQLLRTEKSVSPFYVYTFEKNAVDYIKINSEQGFYPDIDVYVKPVSKYFNDVSELYSGTSATINVIAQALVPDAIDLSYAGSNAVLSWPESSQQFLTITATLEYSGTVLLETTGNNFVIPVDWIGSRAFSVSFSHLPGYSAPAISVVVNPNKPATPVVSARVISNSVTLNYTSAKGSLPIDRYEIRRGGTYDAGQTPEIKAGTSSFTVSEEISAGTVVFWFEAVDTAGNRSDAISVSAIVSQPQNYQLLAQYSAKADSWPGTLTNCLVTESNSLLLPVNTTETWAEHFTNNSFDTPQDQIDAGYEYYLQPSTNTAQYQFTYDYLSLIDSATVTANSAPIILDGSVTVAVEIEYSDDNSTWTSGGAGQTQIIATDFRYIRVTLDFTSVGGDDLAYVEDVLVSIDKRVDDDSGKFSAVSTDATGTRVYFNKDFIDAQTPTVSVSSTEIVDVVVDFNDVPDPEYFDVYVFSRSTGLRINASGSWTVRGFTRIGT